MKIAIIAATGGIGQQALRQAAADHDVTAIVRDPSRLAVPVPAVTVDLAAADPSALAGALHGADAVLSCLGRRSRTDAGVTWHGTEAIVEAMRAAGVRRIVAISAGPIGTVPSPQRPRPPRHDPGDGLIVRSILSPLVKAALRRPYADLARMEDVLRGSELDWTVLRPPRLTNGPLTGKYRTAYGRNVRHGVRISRADVAGFMLQALDEPDTIGQIVAVAY